MYNPQKKINIQHRIVLYVLVSVFIMLAAVFVVVQFTRSRASILRVHFLNVGQGDAIFIEFPDSSTMLIDGGADNSVLYPLGRAMPWWKRRIDYVLVTHDDVDHFGGLFGVFEKYEIGTLMYSKYDVGDDRFSLLLYEAQRSGALLRTINQGGVLSWPQSLSFSILWPPDQFRPMDSNSHSIVSYLAWKDIEFLFTGDLTTAEEKILYQQYPNLHADILKVAHHGSNSSSGIDFLKQLRPRYCIISVGNNNPYGHPHRIVLDHLERVACTIVQTTEHGTASFIVSDSGLLDPRY